MIADKGISTQVACYRGSLLGLPVYKPGVRQVHDIVWTLQIERLESMRLQRLIGTRMQRRLMVDRVPPQCTYHTQYSVFPTHQYKGHHRQ